MAAHDIYIYIYIYIYERYIKPSGQLLHAHAQMVLSQQILKFIFTGKGNSGKKDLLLRSGLEPGSDALQTMPPSQFGSYTVDCCTEC